MTGIALVDGGIFLALVVMVLLLVLCGYRVIRGPSPADRLQAIDAMTSVLIGIIIVLVLVQRSSLLIDVGIALAAFSFVGTVAIARYLSEGRMF
jgi:multicomponent Na+:H+ antiporter subunit F